MCCGLADSAILGAEVCANGVSDHTAQVLTYRIDTDISITKSIYARWFSEENYNMLYLLLSKENWYDIYKPSRVHKEYKSSDVQEGFENVIGTLRFYIDQAFPHRRFECWITSGIKISSQILKMLYSLTISNPHPDNINFYKNSEVYQKPILAAKKLHNDEIFRRAENKSRAVWGILNGNVGNHGASGKTDMEILVDGHLVKSLDSTSAYFNEYLIDIPKKIKNKIPDVPGGFANMRAINETRYPRDKFSKVLVQFRHNELISP
ncbi:hypothetical protein HHI36_003241 [Cryptolaemus montrouzieri]|uniref:Uncharacterized protein n=1 Tax=Cryptolaemus montrouzieri TaxID=559131 RepID=A0ABD2PCW2_9CUCU